MNIPADEKVVSDSRLDLVALASKLYDAIVPEDGSAIKDHAAARKARFVESDLALGRIQGGGERAIVDPKKLHALVGKKLSIADFLSCVRIQTEPLRQFLAQREIDEISTRGAMIQPSLITELKPMNKLDTATLIARLLERLEIPKAKAA